MKQSELKAKLEAIKKLPPIKITQVIIECKNKVYSTSGCHCCWFCDKCGRSGCDNMIYGNDFKKELCDLEEG